MLTHRRNQPDDEQWAPISDLMAVVMLIFMLIAILLFVDIDLENRNYEQRCDEMKNMLSKEFEKDFVIWGAVLAEDLTIHFANQSVNFKTGNADITKEGGADIIGEFFPRYMEVISEIRRIYEKDGEKEVLAIRIDGHTSSGYESSKNPYISNLELSQDRARNIVRYALSLASSNDYERTVHELVTANGLSSSKRICNSNGTEDKNKSQRVEFKLLTNSCQESGVYEKAESLINYCPLEQEPFNES